jgi:hypothetical protein
MSDSTGDTQVAKPNSLGYLSWFGSAAVGVYSGIHLLIPVVAAAVVWQAGTKRFSEAKKVIIPAFALNAGHFLWGLVALALSRGAVLEALWFDLLVYMVGLPWLFTKPSRGPLYLLGIYQLVSFCVNGYAFAEASIASAEHRALLVHVGWRAVSLYFIVKLFLDLKKPSKTEALVAPSNHQN